MEIAILSTDKHIQSSNLKDIEVLYKQEIELALKHNVKEIIWLGDIFDSRISQRQDVLNFVGEMLEEYNAHDLHVTCIPGNHDKTDYKSFNSFLDCFNYHPNFELLTQNTVREINGMIFHFIPFFVEDMWMAQFEKLPPATGKEVLISHCAVYGSINNDGTRVEKTSIVPQLFCNYKKVFLGHYHNAQQIGKNIFHLPSMMQNNYGEDEDKGFTILYDNYSTEFIKGDFKRFKKLSIDLDSVSPEELEKLVKEHENSLNHIRFEFIGSEDKLKALNKSYYQIRGIDVTTKNKEIELSQGIYEDEIKIYNEDEIIKEFEDFCKKNNYNFEEGLKYLK